MFKFIKERIRLWKENAAAQRHKDGFDFAAAYLLRFGDKAVAELEHDIECMRTFDSYDEFDKGVEEAILKYKQVTE